VPDFHWQGYADDHVPLTPSKGPIKTADRETSRSERMLAGTVTDPLAGLAPSSHNESG
jgi:hypothetical protein